MAITLKADLFVPDIFVPGVVEAQSNLPSLVNSPAVVNNALLNGFAAGPGENVQLPYLRNISDAEEEIQVPNQKINVQKITSGKNVAPILNRQIGFGVEALADQVSVLDPVQGVINQIANNRLMRLQKTIRSVLRGAFGVSAIDAALSANFQSETASTADTNFITGEMVNNAVNKLGELASILKNGIFWVHPMIRTALLNLDEGDFFRSSDGEVTIERYKGLPIFTSNALSRVGTTSGTVYESFIIAPSTIAYGDKPQAGGVGSDPVVDTASLNIKLDTDYNTVSVYDRTRQIVHINGMRWKGAPANDSASNAELATGTNWELDAANPQLLGIVRIQTNG